MARATMTAAEMAEWNEILRVELERDHEAAIREDRLRTAAKGCAAGRFGWAAGLTRDDANLVREWCGVA